MKEGRILKLIFGELYENYARERGIYIRTQHAACLIFTCTVTPLKKQTHSPSG
jgi:hypothetical protein